MQMFNSIGDTAESKAHIEAAKELLAEVEVIETGLMELKRAIMNDNVEVHAFLTSGWMAMGIADESRKSERADDSSSESISDSQATKIYVVTEHLTIIYYWLISLAHMHIILQHNIKMLN